MARDIQWDLLEIPILGLNESDDPRLLPPGQFVAVTNAEFSTFTGSVRKRPGMRRFANPSGNVPGGSRLATRRDQLVMLDLEGSVSTPPKMYLPKDGSDQYRTGPNIPNTNLEQKEIFKDLAQPVLCDMAVSNGYSVYIIGLPVTAQIMCKIVELSTGTVVVDSVLANYNGSDIIPKFVRAASSGNYVLLTASIGENLTPVVTPDLIVGFRIDLTGTSPVVGSQITLATDEYAKNAGVFGGPMSLYHDLTGLVTPATTDRWALVYVATSAGPQTNGGLTVKAIGGASLALAWGATGIGTNPKDVRAPSILEVGADLYINWLDSRDWRYKIWNSLTGTLVLADTVWETDVNTNTDFPISAIDLVQTDATKAVLFRSQITDNTLDGRETLGWKVITRTAIPVPTTVSLKNKRGASIWSKPFPDPATGGWHYMWTRVLGKGNNIFFQPGVEMTATACLLHIPDQSRNALLAGTAIGEMTPVDQGNATGQYNYIPCSAFSWGYDGSSFRSALAARYLVGENAWGPTEIRTRFGHLGVGSAIEFGNCTYFTGSVLCQWDGIRFSENSFAVPAPLTVDVVSDGTGNWGGTGSLAYAVCYETITADGERSRSQLSSIVEVDITIATQSVTLKIEPNTITRRYWATTQSEVAPNVLAVVYRTANLNDTTLQRLYSFSLSRTSVEFSSPDADTWIEIKDIGGPTAAEGDADSVAANEIVYATDQGEGELENDMPYGGCTCHAVHKDRLWLGGGIDPEVVWYSKERADGRPAEFSVGQTIRVPGHNVVALGSLGDALAVFCEKAVFSIHGEGPNFTGNPSSGSFSTPIPVDLSIGCDGPRSVAPTPFGLMFKAQEGIYLMNQGRALEFIGLPVVDLTRRYPVVRSAEVVPGSSQVRFVVVNEAGDDGRVLVFDWVEKKWAEWSYTPSDLSDGVYWAGHGFAYLDPDGTLYVEDANYFLDGSTPYVMRLETGWLSFGKVQGYKRVRKTGFLMERLGDHGLDVTVRYAYNESEQSVVSWSRQQLTGIGLVDWLRMTLPRQKQTSYKFILVENLSGINDSPWPEDLAGFALQSMAFEVGMIPGLHRLPATHSR